LAGGQVATPTCVHAMMRARRAVGTGKEADQFGPRFALIGQ
jgi:hypothetical protein